MGGRAGLVIGLCAVLLLPSRPFFPPRVQGHGGACLLFVRMPAVQTIYQRRNSSIIHLSPLGHEIHGFSSSLPLGLPPHQTPHTENHQPFGSRGPPIIIITMTTHFIFFVCWDVYDGSLLFRKFPFPPSPLPPSFFISAGSCHWALN